MVTLAQKVGARLCLDELTIEVDRVLDCFVLDGENFDALHDLIEEKLSQNIVCGATGSFLSREAEVYSVFHDKKALLAF